MIRYIEENRELLRGRPQCFQHGDYHIGNMMFQNGELFIIDFGPVRLRRPLGGVQPHRLVRTGKPAFRRGAAGRVLRRGAAMAFFRLLCLYIASNTLSSVPWAIPFGQQEVDTMTTQAQEVLSWFDGMENPVPTWYREWGEEPLR